MAPEGIDYETASCTLVMTAVEFEATFGFLKGLLDVFARERTVESEAVMALIRGGDIDPGILDRLATVRGLTFTWANRPETATWPMTP